MAGWHSRLAAPCRYWHRTADRLRHVRALPRRAAKMRQRLRSATCGMRRNGEAENQSRLSPVRCGAREDAGTWRWSRSLRMHENGWSDAANLYRLGARESLWTLLSAVYPPCTGPNFVAIRFLVVRFQHSHPARAGTFANVGIKGPLANIRS